MTHSESTGEIQAGLRMPGEARPWNCSATLGKSLSLSAEAAGQGAPPFEGERVESSRGEEGLGKLPGLPRRAGEQGQTSGRRGCCCFEVLSCFIKAKTSWAWVNITLASDLPPPLPAAPASPSFS